MTPLGFFSFFIPFTATATAAGVFFFRDQLPIRRQYMDELCLKIASRLGCQVILAPSHSIWAEKPNAAGCYTSGQILLRRDCSEVVNHELLHLLQTRVALARAFSGKVPSLTLSLNQNQNYKRALESLLRPFGLTLISTIADEALEQFKSAGYPAESYSRELPALYAGKDLRVIPAVAKKLCSLGVLDLS
jgi:hypothetical protein